MTTSACARTSEVPFGIGLPGFRKKKAQNGPSTAPNRGSPEADATCTTRTCINQQHYGHRNGTNAFSADGYYAVTPRITLTVSYSNTLGTQLEGLQNQLNLASVNGTLAPTRTLTTDQEGDEVSSPAHRLVRNVSFQLTGACHHQSRTRSWLCSDGRVGRRW